jgi:hypothetical protein
MRRDVIAVSMGDEGKRLGVPGVEPDRLIRQVNAALVSNFNHAAEFTQAGEL